MTPAPPASQQLRLLMTADAVGGVWTYALCLCHKLTRRGARVLLATMGPPPSVAQRRAAEAIEGLSLVTSDYRLEWMDEPWLDVDRASSWLLALEREFRPDVVHLNGYCHAALPFSAPAISVAHSCVLSWWRATLSEDAPEQYAEYRARVAAGLSRAARVVAPTRAMLDAVRRHYDARIEGCVIPNGIEQLGVPGIGKEPFVLAAGRVWDVAKNVALLDTVAASVPWPIKIAGDHRAPSGETAQFQHVELLGLQSPSEMSSLMARTSIFVHPARYEPFGLAPLEAACLGSALVLSDIPSLREVWGTAALYVHPDDAAGFSRAISRLCGDPEFLAVMASRARRHARRYSAAAMAAAYMNVYRELRDSAASSTESPLVGLEATTT
jgi:glycosyltransferase involved in cell wall biosynthesis